MYQRILRLVVIFVLLQIRGRKAERFFYFYEMEINDFIEKFGGCLHHTRVSEVAPKTQFKKLEDWSSIFALIVIAMVDSEYSKVLTAEDIHKADTIEDLYGIIHSK